MTAADGTPPGPAADVRPAQVATDLLLVASVPLLLVAIHVLVPANVREAYVLVPDDATPLTLFTAAFLHLTDAHLLGNVVGYAVGALSAYVLCLLLGERRWFALSTVALVLGLPVLVNWTSLRVLAAYVGEISAPSRGFSGVAAGFGGFALAALLAVVDRWTDRGTALFGGLAVGLLLLWEVLVIYAGEFPPASTGLVALAVGLCLAQVGRRGYRSGLPDSRAAWRLVGSVGLVVAGVLAILVVFVANLFPPVVFADGQFTNVFAHAIGFGLGFVVTGWGYRYWHVR